MQEAQQLPAAATANNANRKKKKKGKYDDYTTSPANTVFFLFDVETTGGRRNYDRIIAMSYLCFDREGTLIGSFSRKVNPGKVRISAYLTRHIHSKLDSVHMQIFSTHIHVTLTQG